jgi:hypothetical protein
MLEPVPPTFGSDGFECPHCRAYAHQAWYDVVRRRDARYDAIGGFTASLCLRCESYAIWLGREMIHPLASTAPPPNADLPADVRDDYVEAAAVLPYSPRASAALLRLSIQKLCVSLGQADRDLNAAIGALVRDGLPLRVQQALDVVRVVGNNAVHPGEMDLRDDRVTAVALFGLVNLIAEAMITEPERVEALYASLPPGSKDAITKRDGESG